VTLLDWAVLIRAMLAHARDDKQHAARSASEAPVRLLPERAL
jgi:hypothetical protein